MTRPTHRRQSAVIGITDERGKVLGYRNLSELRRRLKPSMLRCDRALVRIAHVEWIGLEFPPERQAVSVAG